MTRILVALMLAVTANASAVTTNTYERIVLGSSAYGTKYTSVCRSHVMSCSTTNGMNLMSVNSTSRPAGATTQWATFWFYSQGYFSKQDKGHFAMALFGRYSGGLSGRGMLIGNTSQKLENGTLTGCLDPNRAQFETYWQSGNHTFPESCSSFRWADNTWYGVTVHVNTNGWMYYEVTDLYGNSLYYSVVHDSWNPENIAANSGFWFAQVLENGANWRIQLDKVQVGWF